MTSEAIEESGVKVFMFALVLGSGTARRFESIPLDANEPGGIGQVNPGRRTAMSLQGNPHLLFLYDVGAIGASAAAAHFGRVCAGSITHGRPIGMDCSHDTGDDRAARLSAK